MNLLYCHPTPLIFAHRGSSAHAPENTLAAFKLAETNGALAIELDVKLSADGVVVVIHDPTTDRTSGVSGSVNKMTFTELRHLDVGSFFSNKYKGEKIPALEDVFELLGKRLLVNVELTNYTSPGDLLVEKTVEVIKRHGVEETVIFSSFSPLNLIKARRLLPEVPVGLLASEGAAGGWARSFLARHLFPGIIHPYYRDASKEYISKQHHNRRRVHVWTVNDPAEMRRLFNAGVDGIFSDDPVLAMKVAEAE
jgi:glycerophosphoryl diester phosphodiesterase